MVSSGILLPMALAIFLAKESAAGEGAPPLPPFTFTSIYRVSQGFSGGVPKVRADTKAGGGHPDKAGRARHR